MIGASRTPRRSRRRGVRLDAITPPRAHRRRRRGPGPGRARPAAAPPAGRPSRPARPRARPGAPARRRPARRRPPSSGGPPAIRSAAARHAAASRPVSSVSRPSNRSSVERRRPSTVTQACGARSPAPAATTDDAYRTPRSSPSGSGSGGPPRCSDRRARHSPGERRSALVAVQQRRRPPTRAPPRPASSPGCGPRRSRCSCRPPPTGRHPVRRVADEEAVARAEGVRELGGHRERQPRQHLHVEVRHPDGRPDQLDAPRRREVVGRLAALGEPLPRVAPAGRRRRAPARRPRPGSR